MIRICFLITLLSSFFLSFLSILLISCEDDNDLKKDNPEYNYIELNMEDHRYEDLPNYAYIENAQGKNDISNFVVRNDSLFISYLGILLYPIRLPNDFYAMDLTFYFSGTIKYCKGEQDFYPLILKEFKYVNVINY